MSFVSIIVIVLLITGGVIFILAIFRAISFSKAATPEQMPAFLQVVIKIIGGALATNLGAVLGITIKESENRGFEAARILLLEGADTPTAIQIIAAIVYLAGLFIALFGWGKLGFKEEPKKIVPELPGLTYTLVGVISGILIVALK